MKMIDWCIQNWDGVLAIIGGTVALATAVVKLTPTPADDAVLTRVIGMLSALSLCNPDGSFVGKAK